MRRFGKAARRGVRLAAAVWLSVSLQSVVIVSLAAARQQHDDAPTRPRRVTGVLQGEPLVRIGLVVDAASVTLTSASGLAVRDAADSPDDEKVVTGQMRVEVRRAAAPAPAPVRPPAATPARPAAYRIEVAALADERRARDILDDLSKRFFEPAVIAYDNDDKKHRVLIGTYKSEKEAEGMIARLGRAGYKGARAVPDAPLAARRSDDQKRDDRDRPAPVIVPQVVATDANKAIAISRTSLVIAPAGSGGYQPAYKTTEAARRGDVEIVPRKGAERGALTVRPPAVRFGNKDYRGEIHLVLNPRGRLNVVNVVSLEDYLRGVVPLELSPGGFPALEALKAQAVAARTYALANRDRFRAEGFDLTDDARSQVYGGLTAEHPLTNRAVEETRGLVAVYVNAEGREVPINALYSSTCGGRTEHNEAIFPGDPLPYLRSVECAPDRQVYEGHEVVSSLTPELPGGAEGRMAREVALLQVLEFALPRRVTEPYLRAAVARDEVWAWAERAAGMAARPRPPAPRDDVTRLPAFAQLLAAALYGEGRASLLLSEADADYLLGGLAEGLPRPARADVAMLLKEGVLRVPEDARAPLTRGYALGALARALYLQSQSPTAGFRAAVAQPAAGNRLTLAPPKKKSGAEEPPEEFEVERDAWLFRRLGGESFQVGRLALIGGERVTFHVNSRGRVDFLEAEANERGAASDRFSSAWRWTERVSAEELRGRLSRSRINVGELVDLRPVAHGASGRLVEVEVIGAERRASLRGGQIRNAFNLKDNLFVIGRELDGRGRVTAFVFTGRGWGHGVGMCQTGAYGLAKEGYSYQAILQKYYTGVRLRRTY